MRREVRPACLLPIDAFKTLARDVARTATVLLIEHNMDVVMDLAHRITVLDSGRFLAEGTPAPSTRTRPVSGGVMLEAYLI